jgi:hypothetical protein
VLAVVEAVLARLKSIQGLPLPRDTPEILDKLRMLRDAPIDVHVLKRTGAGVELSKTFFRKHANKEIRIASAELVAGWRALVEARQEAALDSCGAISPTSSFTFPSLELSSEAACSPVEELPPPTPDVHEANADELESAKPAEITLSDMDFLSRCRSALVEAAGAQEAKKRKDAKKRAATKVLQQFFQSNGKIGAQKSGRVESSAKRSKDAGKPSKDSTGQTKSTENKESRSRDDTKTKDRTRDRKSGDRGGVVEAAKRKSDHDGLSQKRAKTEHTVVLPVVA